MIGELLSALGLDIDSGIGSSIHFFIYDVIKIMILLCSEIYSEGYQMQIDILPNNVYAVGDDRCKGVCSYEIL